MKIEFQGKSVLVTGAGSGIGRACAERLAESGAVLWVQDRNEEAVTETASRIASQGGVAGVLVGDVAAPGDWLDPVLKTGNLYGVIHNAGYNLSTPLGKTEPAAFDKMLRVMVSGPFEMTQRLLPALSAENGGGGGAVIFIASVHAMATEPATSAYAAAKGAMISMVRSLAQDLGPHGVRAVAIAPGYVDTPLLRQWIDSAPDPALTRSQADSLHPIGRMGRPDDIAAMAAFLMSAEASFVNGTTVVVDGGLTAMLAD